MKIISKYEKLAIPILEILFCDFKMMEFLLCRKICYAELNLVYYLERIFKKNLWEICETTLKII